MTQHKNKGRRYSGGEKAAAVRMVRTLHAELGTSQETVQRVAGQLGYGVESVRSWVRQADIDDGINTGVTTDEQARMKALEIEGVRREKRVKTTKPDPAATRHPDLVNRVFSADAPNRLGHGFDVRADVAGRRLRVIHCRCVRPRDRRVAVCIKRENRDRA